MKEHNVFFDQSQELHNQFDRVGLNKTQEVVTRGLDPLEASRYTLKLLKPFLSHECLFAFKQLEAKLERQLEKLKNMRWRNRKVIFFLGSLKKRKLPQTMILNDGFVKILKKYNKINTYPSNLDYSTWSQKVLEKFIDKKTLLIGVNSVDQIGFSINQYNSQKIDLNSFGSLIPGITQMNYLESLAKWLETP